MNCEQFEIELMKDPSCEDRDFVAHRKSCAHCAREWRKAREFEAILRSSMAVQPTRELRVDPPVIRQVRWWQQTWAKAASVLFLIGATVAGYNLAQSMFAGENLPQLVVHHIQKEPEMLGAEQTLDQMALIEVLSPMAFSLEEPIGGITAAVPCWIRKGRGMHLVMQGQSGPVTILLMPGEHVQQQQTVSANALSGMLVPTGWGSMAVVSHAGDDVEPVIHSLQQNVRWKGQATSTTF
ncbi:DUF3379 family protein [Thiolapillus sp.]